MSRRLVLLLNEFNANVARARRAYESDPFALARLLEAPCIYCEIDEHADCNGRARGGGGNSFPCGCAERDHYPEGVA